jgi:hypothetical protein
LRVPLGAHRVRGTISSIEDQGTTRPCHPEMTLRRVAGNVQHESQTGLIRSMCCGRRLPVYGVSWRTTTRPGISFDCYGRTERSRPICFPITLMRSRCHANGDARLRTPECVTPRLGRSHLTRSTTSPPHNRMISSVTLNKSGGERGWRRCRIEAERSNAERTDERIRPPVLVSDRRCRWAWSTCGSRPQVA